MLAPSSFAFDSLLPHASEYQRALDMATRDGVVEAGSTRLSALGPSVLQDLTRFGQANGALEVLEVMAASVRHARPLLLHLQYRYRVLPLSVHPAQRVAHCPLSATALLQLRLPDLRVLHVEPARREAPEDAAELAAASGWLPLPGLLWELALRGAREALLPEIAGPVAYRVSPGARFQGLPLSGSLASAVERLRRGPASLRDIAGWPGFDETRASRLLNALYLQATLMVSRAHPVATAAGSLAGAALPAGILAPAPRPDALRADPVTTILEPRGNDDETVPAWPPGAAPR